MSNQVYRQYARRWLTGVPYRLPCWEGIIPGQTTVDEAIERLRQTPGIVPESVERLEPPRLTTENITWKWIDSSYLGGEALYSLDTPNPVVTQIRPYFEQLPGNQSVFSLGEVIDTYGVPSHVQALVFYGRHGDGPFYSVSVWYLPLGLCIEKRSLFRQKPRVHAGRRFNRVSFFPSRLALHPEWHTRLVTWQGYQDFDAYCLGVGL